MAIAFKYSSDRASEGKTLWTPENESFFINFFKGDKIIASF